MGRLIDANKLMEDVRKNSESYFADDFAEQWVNRQQTVEAIPITYITSRISRLRQHKTYAGDFGADLLQAVINDYNKEKDNGKTE